ncbi:hypothetical protein GYMLUDRAFT_246171 [Collybiopsis luxurians FD-317 M1]|uniref:Unplaced genomic scaffold GYMLUscaffold_37, whole genome shotgun sequence n=1 Tax=Collybiopsis luxurians FD-317 M1 TaxID=944289 RepID=A0A0D0CJG0_9AGAR|nr:hypothetical protein GYMLUDRAFT_246171 [Collybiopsis luxurians FD-317 M1]
MNSVILCSTGLENPAQRKQSVCSKTISPELVDTGFESTDDDDPSSPECLYGIEPNLLQDNPSVPVPEPMKSIPSMAAKETFMLMKNFSGDLTDSTHPSTWLRELQKTFMAMGIPEKDYVAKMGMFLEEDSIAEEWYTNLSAADKAKSWEDFCLLFHTEFPSQKKEKKEPKAYLEELEEMHITHEQLLTRHEGTQVPYHRWFTDCLLALAKGATIETTKEAIGTTWKNLPYALKKSVNDNHSNWGLFMKAIEGVDWAMLKVEAEYAVDMQKTKERVEALQATPRTKLANSLALTRLGEPPSPTPNQFR